MFGVGSVTITSSDKSQPTLVLQNIKDPVSVKELIHTQVEEMKIRRRVRIGEFSNMNTDVDDDEDDSIDDNN